MAQRFGNWILWQLKTLTGYQSPLRLQYATSQADQNDQPPWPTTSTSSSVILLPLEVIGEILKYLDWKDLSNASLADRTWYRATHSRQLWYAMAKELQLVYGMGRLEEPMGDYTVAELRRWVVRRLRTQEAWSTANSTVTFKERSINHPDVQFAKLLPGGRWLLVTDQDGKLFYYDLESMELEKRLLIDPGLGDNATMPDKLSRFDYWIDQSKKNLTFRVALWNGARKMDITRICIYQVDLTGHGETAVLVAKLLSVVRDYMQVVKWVVGLSEKYLVDCRVVNHRDRRFSLVQYGADDPESTRICIPYPGSRAYEIYIIPSDLLVVVDLHYIDIYAIRQLEEYEDNGPEENQQQISPLHHIVCDAALNRTSIPFIFQGYTWLIFSHQDQIHLTRIPCDEEDDFKTVSLGEYPIGRRDITIPFFGLASTIIVRPDYTADTVTYSWDAEMNVTTYLIRPITIPTLENEFWHLNPAGVAGEIGRIAFRSRRDNECIVLDLVL